MSKRKPEHPQRPSNTLTTISLVEVQAEEKKEVPDKKPILMKWPELKGWAERGWKQLHPGDMIGNPIIFNFIIGDTDTSEQFPPCSFIVLKVI